LDYLDWIFIVYFVIESVFMRVLIIMVMELTKNLVKITGGQGIFSTFE